MSKTFEQAELFPPPRARNTDPATSHAAAASMQNEAGSQRAAIYAHLRKNGPAIADELDAALGLRLTSAGRRLAELHDQGLVERTEQTRDTRSGRKAYLWRAL